MDLVILASVLAFGGLFALTGLFDGGDSGGDNPDPDNPDPENPDDPPFVHGGAGDDSLGATFGTLSGWRGDDDLDLAGTAHGYGNQGDDRIFAGDSGQAHGGQGNDRLEGAGSATLWGDDGEDRITTWEYHASAEAPLVAHGGAGNDALLAGVGHAHGDAGDDFLSGTGFEDYPLYDGLGTTLHGGAGNDLLFGWQNAQAEGDAGNDTLALGNGADGRGGAGDDTLILAPTWFGASADAGTIHATGGAGQDVFAVDMEVARGYALPATAVITDFTPGEDRLLVELADMQTGDHVYDHASVTENAVLGYSEVTLHWRALTPGAEELTSRLRLDGVQGFDPADIELAAPVDAPFHGSPLAGVGAVLTPAPGSDGADILTRQNDDFVDAGAGNDTVTTAPRGEVVADLGAGDDRFVATGAGHVVFGGDGDDDYVMAAPAGTLGELSAQFDGGAGDDRVVIEDDGDSSGLAPADRPSLGGGAGNDHLEARAGTGPLTLTGGAGDDVLIGRAGQLLAAGYGSDDGDDAVSLTVTAADLAANGAASVTMGTTDQLTLILDPALQGRISVHYNTAGNGAEVTSSEIRVGGRVVAIIREGVPMIEDAIALDDPRLTVMRA